MLDAVFPGKVLRWGTSWMRRQISWVISTWCTCVRSTTGRPCATSGCFTCGEWRTVWATCWKLTRDVYLYPPSRQVCHLLVSFRLVEFAVSPYQMQVSDSWGLSLSVFLFLRQYIWDWQCLAVGGCHSSLAGLLSHRALGSEVAQPDALIWIVKRRCLT